MSEKELRLFPMIPKAQYLDITMHPGDMVFIPSGWWHYVKVFTGAHRDLEAHQDDLEAHQDVPELSVSVAARSYSTCEGISYFPSFVVNWIHSFNLLDARGFCLRPSYV